MKRKLNKKGFTLAELLIVIAIIAILIAIAIPVFSGALDSARKATDDANIRAAYAQYTVDQMTDPDFDGTITISSTDAQAYVIKFITGSATASASDALKHYGSVEVDSTGKWVGKE